MRLFKFVPDNLRLSGLQWVLLATLGVFPKQEDAARPAPTPTSESAALSAMPRDDSDGAALNRLVTQWVLESVPHTIHDDRDWGTTTKRFNGVRLRREGTRLETKRDWVDVNHGVWRKATARLVDPEKQFSIEIKNVRLTDQAETAFDVAVHSPLAAEVRQSHWVQGVQLYSVSADLTATVKLTLSCTLDVQWDFADRTRAVEIKPRVTAADLLLEDFAVQHVSKLGGEFAQQVTKIAESYLARQTDTHERVIVEKLNRQIAKESDNLRISIAELSETPWGKVLLKGIESGER